MASLMSGAMSLFGLSVCVLQHTKNTNTTAILLLVFDVLICSANLWSFWLFVFVFVFV
jgi:hypothetical protein